MEFEEKLKNFIIRIEETKKNIKTEEATKTSLIMPLFQLLGYDVFNPNEFTPEFVADVGIKKGEKVDYAIVLDNEVVILIEAKSISEKLEKHDSQLFRYFGTTKAKFAILTNGITYKFFTDLEKPNVMDTTPFLEINLEKIRDNEIQELKKFQKENFDINKIFSTAEDLKYLGLMKKAIKEEFDNPSDEFIKLILNKNIYEGVKTSAVIEKYRPILKKSINSYINELINNKFQSIMENNDEEEDNEIDNNLNDKEIITTEEEIQSYYIVKSILSEYCDPNRIYYKDTYSYFGILFDNKVTKWICRIYIKDSVKYITFPSETKKEIRYDIKNVEEIYNFKNLLVKQLSNFINIKQKESIEVLQ